MRYSICLAFAMRSLTSSFLLAINDQSMCERNARERGVGGMEFTLEHVWGVDFVRIALLGDGDLCGDLRKVGAGGEVRDAAGHDGEELRVRGHNERVSESGERPRVWGACFLNLILELRDAVHARQFL